MNCPDGYRVERIAKDYLLSHIAEKEWGNAKSWKEVILNPEDGKPFSDTESRNLQPGDPVWVKIKNYKPTNPPQTGQYKLVSKNPTYFKNSPEIQVSGKDENTIKALEKDSLICKVPPDTVFRLREYPKKIKQHWQINLLDIYKGKHEWYAYESDFSEPQAI